MTKMNVANIQVSNIAAGSTEYLEVSKVYYFRSHFLSIFPSYFENNRMWVKAK